MRIPNAAPSDALKSIKLRPRLLHFAKLSETGLSKVVLLCYINTKCGERKGVLKVRIKRRHGARGFNVPANFFGPIGSVAPG